MSEGGTTYTRTDSTRGTINEALYQQRLDQASKASEAAAVREPGITDYGLLEYGDAPLAIAGGMMGFSSFKTEADLLHFLREHLTFLHPGPSGEDPFPRLEGVRKVCDEVEQGRLTWGDAVTPLNELLTGFTQIVWVGPIADLVQADSGFAREVRLWFREGEYEDDDQGHSEPIATEELALFLERLQEYGV